MKPDALPLIHTFWPLLLIGVGAFASLITSVWGSVRSFRVTGLLAFGIFLGAAYGFATLDPVAHSLAGGILRADGLGYFLSFLICLIGAVTVVFSFNYWENLSEPVQEVLPLILFAALGMVLMVLTTHLLTLVLALELMSLSLYVLVGSRRADPKSSEAAIKYFLLGSVAAAFLLFGISFLYGATGQMDLSLMGQQALSPDKALLFQVGVLLLLIGFAFKVAAVPFHFWAPDVYEGSPAPVTGFMAAGVKVAAFGAWLRLLHVLVSWEFLELRTLLVILSLLTMFVGNLAALRQRSLKRIMAYSSVAHAGYLLLGLATLVEGAVFLEAGMGVILFYLGTYGLLTLGVFAMLTLFSSKGKEISKLDDLKGLGYTNPVFAAALTVFLISLAGIPPTAGFVAKYFLFARAIETGLIWPAILGILTSAVSLYYYLGPVVQMYFHDPVGEKSMPAATLGMKVLVSFLVLGAFYLGLFPGKYLTWSNGIRLEASRSTPILSGMPQTRP